MSFLCKAKIGWKSSITATKKSTRAQPKKQKATTKMEEQSIFNDEFIARSMHVDIDRNGLPHTIWPGRYGCFINIAYKWFSKKKNYFFHAMNNWIKQTNKLSANWKFNRTKSSSALRVYIYTPKTIQNINKTKPKRKNHNCRTMCCAGQ